MNFKIRNFLSDIVIYPILCSVDYMKTLFFPANCIAIIEADRK